MHLRIDLDSESQNPSVGQATGTCLVQDTAYASLLRSRRQRIHADIARALVQRFAEEVETTPAIIARHFTEADLAGPAVRYWLKAAELALSRSVDLEAADYADAGLALIPRLNDGAAAPTSRTCARQSRPGQRDIPGQRSSCA